MARLPKGTVTFLFTDIEGSTLLLQRLGDRYAEVLAGQRRLLRRVFGKHGGHEVDVQGDSVFFAFPRAHDAVAAAVSAQETICTQTWPDGVAVRVRMGLHTGEPLTAASGYVGLDVHRAARIASAAWGGQIVLSQTTHNLVAERLPDRIALRDLGLHGLKDLARQQRLFQVIAAGLPADFPALRSLDAWPNNLPRQLSSFIGREREMARVREILAQTPLLTLTGTGGSGKTRLALQAAADLLEEFPDGVWLVDLAPVLDAALVAQTLATVLGVREEPGRALAVTLIEHLKSRHALLVVDNCEHLLDACANLVESLLHACPSLHALATSREPLGIQGELTYRIPPLSVPDPGEQLSLEGVAGHEAVRLFVERATSARPEFSLTRENARELVEICHRLDGIPLAIELAAARVKGMSLSQIASRLDDCFRLLTGGSRTALPRQRTLRATVDWSYDLLSAAERILLSRLSVFTGGWTLDAAEAICSGDGIAAREVPDLLALLVDKSLVIADAWDSSVRYRMLETIRQYASEKLGETEATARVRERHADWCLNLAERAEPMVRGPDQSTWLARLELERGNLRAAMEWTRDRSRQRDKFLRLAGALWRFWTVRGYLSEGREWLRQAMETCGDGPPEARAKALYGAGVLAFWHRDDASAASLFAQALVLSRELGDRQTTASCLRMMAQVRWDESDNAGARRHAEESLGLFRELGDKWGISAALRMLGIISATEENYTEARALFEESLGLARQLGDRRGVAWSLHGLDWCLHGVGPASGQRALDRGSNLSREALAHFRDLGDKAGTVSALLWLGLLSPDPLRAIRLLAASETLRQTIGTLIPAVYRAAYARRLEALKHELPESTFTSEWTKGCAMSPEDAVTYALNE